MAPTCKARVYCDSRGGSLNLGTKIEVVAVKGLNLCSARTRILSDLASSFFKLVVVFVRSGDIPFLRTEPAQHYREVVQELSCLDDVKRKVIQLTTEVRDLGSVIVWATIPPMSFNFYNSYMFENFRTDLLLFKPQYQFFQELHQQLVIDFNLFLISINCQEKLCTPYLHRLVQRRKKSQHIFDFHHFYDGLHPDGFLVFKWSQMLSKAIECNFYHLDL